MQRQILIVRQRRPDEADVCGTLAVYTPVCLLRCVCEDTLYTACMCVCACMRACVMETEELLMDSQMFKSDLICSFTRPDDIIAAVRHTR